MTTKPALILLLAVFLIGGDVQAQDASDRSKWVSAAVGHPAIALLPDGSSIFAWIESGNPESHLLVRLIRTDADLGPTVEIGGGSSFGYPSMWAQGNRLLLAWMQADKTGSNLHLARIGSGKLQ